jgi:N-acetyltransferase 10
VTDLLPAVARAYFTGRFGDGFKLSSVQAAILCGIGVQNRDVDSLTKELGLPSNQVLAMFNKGIRKISIAMNAIVEEKEKESLLGGEKRLKAQKTVERMRDVAQKTLEEDAADAAKDAMESLNKRE